MAGKKKLSSDELELLKVLTRLPEKYEFELISTTEGIEPFYFWILDFMTNRMGFDVKKSEEQIGASVVSGFFGEMVVRREKLEEQAMKYLGTINTVVKSIINILYDLREFDRRLAIYDDLKSDDRSKAEAADLALKRIWMDEVDVRKGGASINSLSSTRGLEFVTLRDAFMSIPDVEAIENLDLNERVKRILKGRIEEYGKWKKESDKELRQRRKIEMTYLKAQVESLRLYTVWAKPYMKAAQMLQFKDPKLDDPQLIQAFDQNYLEFTIRGTKKYYLREFLEPGANNLSYKPPERLTREEKETLRRARVGEYALGLVEVKCTYRARPYMMYLQEQQQRHPVNLGKMNISFTAYTMREDEYELMKKEEEMEALKFIEGITKESLETMREDIEKYLGELDGIGEKKEKKVPILDQIFFGRSSGAEKPTEGGAGLSSPFFGGSRIIMQNRAKALARRKVADTMFTIYDVFKKAHRLLSFPYPPDWYKPLAYEYKPPK
jgi:hypothetical protein